MSRDKSHTDGHGLGDGIEQGLKKLGLTVPVWDREVTKAEIQYFIDRWLYLQILSTNKVDTFDEVQQVRAKTNWNILSYGDALTSSPGEFIFGGGDFRIKPKNEDDDDGEGGGIVNPDKGTIWAQAFATVGEMVALAQQLGWSGIHVVDGHPLMKWAAWMHAVDEEMSLSGYEPLEKDIARRERVKRSESEDAKRFTVRVRPSM